MSDVFLRHPDLPADQWIEVSAESRVHYSGAGWQLVPEEDVAARNADRGHAAAVADALMAGLPLPVRAGAQSEPDAAEEPDPKPARAKPAARTTDKQAAPFAAVTEGA